jgi:hypothetical protein
VWSGAASQITGSDFVGVPEECFPYTNRKYPPNGEYPIKIDATPGGQQVLVLTINGTFILTESADGLHEWETISDTLGCLNANSYQRTPRGPMWLTKRRQLVMLNIQTSQLEVLSEEFDKLIISSGYYNVSAGSTYINDPQNSLDCYKVYRSDNTCVVYDFNFCPNQLSGRGGMAYEEQANTCDAAGFLRDSFEGMHYIYASGKSLFSQEGDPHNLGLIPCRDEFSSGVYTEIDADYISQWLYLPDRLERTRMTEIDLIGDAQDSATLGTSPVTITFYTDLKSESNLLTLSKALQSQSNLHFQARTRTSNPFYFKLRIQFAGHSADLDSQYFLDSDAAGGELSPSDLDNCYGCVYAVFVDMKPSGGRP